MTDHIYKHIDVTGTSAVSMEQAVQNAVARAAKTMHKLRWFEITDSRGSIEEGRVSKWQVTVKIGFTLDE